MCAKLAEHSQDQSAGCVNGSAENGTRTTAPQQDSPRPGRMAGLQAL
jgi:hypothetical protein